MYLLYFVFVSLPGGLPPPRPHGLGGCRPANPLLGVWGAAAPQPRGSGGREPPRERKTISNTGQRPATQTSLSFLFAGKLATQMAATICLHTGGGTNGGGQNKPQGTALELIYRAENRCTSSEAPAEAGRRADFYVFPTRTRPKSVPEARYRARKHYCITWGSLKARYGTARSGGPGGGNRPEVH